MRIAFLTTNDPLYLPAFFEKVLGVHRQEVFVFSVPPLYGKQTSLDAVRRFHRTFGLGPLCHLAWKVALARLRRQSIRSVCQRHGVVYEEARDVNSVTFIQRLRELALDVVVSVSCPQVFKPQLLGVSKLGVLNIHGALLPNYRGVLPAFWILAADEQSAGVSVHFVTEKIDAGDVCGQRGFQIEVRDSLDSFLKRSKKAAAELLLEVLQQLRDGEIERRPLNLAEGSYFSWPTAEDYRRFRLSGRRLF